MTTQCLLNHKFVFAMAAWALFMGISPGRAVAMPSDSVSIVQTTSAREAQIEKIMSVLSRPEAQLHLRTMGIRLSELKDRLSKLDDSQLAMVAEKADTVKAGGELVGLIIALLVVAILVVVLIMLLNKDIRVKDKT